MKPDRKVTYYALLDDDGTVSGILRRTEDGPVFTDETFRRDLTWQPSEFLRKYHLGHNDSDYREITAEEAMKKVDEWTRKWAQEKDRS